MDRLSVRPKSLIWIGLTKTKSGNFIAAFRHTWAWVHLSGEGVLPKSGGGKLGGQLSVREGEDRGGGSF